MKTFVYKRRVFFYETDAQGVVHHSNYPRYFEEARGYFLEYIGYPYEKIRKELGIDIIVLELNVKYKKPLAFGDRFEIETKLVKINKYFFEFEYILKKSTDNNIVCGGRTKHCCISVNTKKIVPVPEVISDLI